MEVNELYEKIIAANRRWNFGEVSTLEREAGYKTAARLPPLRVSGKTFAGGVVYPGDVIVAGKRVWCEFIRCKNISFENPLELDLACCFIRCLNADELRQFIRWEPRIK
jgi:hypothetical protein